MSKVTSFLADVEAGIVADFIEGGLDPEVAAASARVTARKATCRAFGKTEAELNTIMEAERVEAAGRLGVIVGAALRYNEARPFGAKETVDRKIMPESFQKRLSLAVQNVDTLRKSHEAMVAELPYLREVAASGDIPAGLVVANVRKLQTSGAVALGDANNGKSPHAGEAVTVELIEAVIDAVEIMEAEAEACRTFLDAVRSPRNPHGDEVTNEAEAS